MATHLRLKPPALIFVLDDDDFSLDLLRQVLKQRPRTEARCFSTLADLLKDPDIIRADLFIIDIRLGGELSGFEVPHMLPTRCKFAAFLFVSGFKVQDAEYKRAAGLPLFDFLAKPFCNSQFLHRIDLLLTARIKIPAGLDDRRAGRLRQLYHDLLAKDRALIRAVKPLPTTIGAWKGKP